MFANAGIIESKKSFIWRHKNSNADPLSYSFDWSLKIIDTGNMRTPWDLIFIGTSFLFSACAITPSSRVSGDLFKTDDLIVTNSETSSEIPKRVDTGVAEFKYILLIANSSASSEYTIDVEGAHLTIDGKTALATLNCNEHKPLIIATGKSARLGCEIQVKASPENKLSIRDVKSVLQIPYRTSGHENLTVMEFGYQLRSEDFE